MPTYAKDTNVSVAKSKEEIEATLTRYGASSFISGWNQDRAMVGFVFGGRQVRLYLTLPDKKEFAYTPERGIRRSESSQQEAWEQACRQRWRALALVVKAKLEAVEAGISTFEEEFLAHIVLPDGSTAGQFLLPQIKIAYESGAMPPLLPMLASGKE